MSLSMRGTKYLTLTSKDFNDFYGRSKVEYFCGFWRFFRLLNARGVAGPAGPSKVPKSLAIWVLSMPFPPLPCPTGTVNQMPDICPTVFQDGENEPDFSAGDEKIIQRISRREMSDGLNASCMGDADSELVKRSQNADTAAFEELIRQYQRMIYALTYRMTGSLASIQSLHPRNILTGLRAGWHFPRQGQVFDVALSHCGQYLPQLAPK